MGSINFEEEWLDRRFEIHMVSLRSIIVQIMWWSSGKKSKVFKNFPYTEKGIKVCISQNFS